MENKMPMGLRFSILHRSFMKQLDERLQERGLTGVQFGVLGQLRRLSRDGKEVNQRDLEEACRVSHPTMTEIVKRLEKQGFLVCQPSARDRRFKRIQATDKAKELQQEMNEADGAIFQQLTRGLSREEIDSLTAVTDKMINNVCACGQKGSEGRCDQDLR